VARLAEYRRCRRYGQHDDARQQQRQRRHHKQTFAAEHPRQCRETGCGRVPDRGGCGRRPGRWRPAAAETRLCPERAALDPRVPRRTRLDRPAVPPTRHHLPPRPLVGADLVPRTGRRFARSEERETTADERTEDDEVVVLLARAPDGDGRTDVHQGTASACVSLPHA
jgi:hypothetical protein